MGFSLASWRFDKFTYAIDTDNISTAWSWTDINKEHLVLLDILNLIVAVCFCTDDSLENGGLNIDLDEDLRHVAGVSNDTANHSIWAGELGVYLGTNG